MLGVVKLVPVPRDVPPDDAAYQFIVPALAEAPRVTVPGPHREADVVPVIVGIALTVSMAALVVALLPPLQLVI